MALGSEKSWLDKKLFKPRKVFSGAGLPNRAKGQIFHHARAWQFILAWGLGCKGGGEEEKKIGREKFCFFPKASSMLGFSFSCLTAWGSDLARTVVCGRRGCKGKERKGRERKGRERKGKEGKGRERKGKEGKGRERKGKDGKGRERKGKDGKGRDRKGKEGTGRERKGKDGKGRKRERKGKEGKGRERKGKEGKGWERKGKEGKGWERNGKGWERKGKKWSGRLRTAWVQGSGWKWVGRRSRWWWATLAARTAADGKWVRRTAWTAADGVGAMEWLEMGGEKKPLVMSDLGCADGCGRQMGAEKCADGCGRRGCKGVAGNGWREEAAGDERPWLRGRLRTGNGCGELRGRLQTAWVQRSGWKWVGRRSRWWWATLAARTAADGKWVRRTARKAADGVGARGWLEMGGEKKPLVMSDLGCADGCGRQMGAENCADGCGRRGCKGVAGNGWGEEAAGDERPWLRGRLRTANGCGELRGRLRMAWVQRSGWKWVGRRSRWWWATLAARTAADGKWVRRTARTAADGVGARGWLEMGGEKKPLVMSDLSCADGCGRQMGAENCAGGCGRRGCNGVAGNGWGEGKGRERKGQEGKGRDRNGKERKGWERKEKGRSRWWWATLAARTAADGKWVRRTAWTAADGVGATEWLEMGGEKKPLVMSDLGCADGCGRQMGAENCADGCGRCGCKGVAGNGWGEEAAGDERPWLL